MFRFHKSLDVITLFHKPSLQSSRRILTILKEASARASETGTEDQAPGHSHQNKRTEFELNVTEDPPTTDQLKTILEYTGAHNAGRIVDGARDLSDAISKLAEDSKKFKPPVTVDWNNGRAVVGDSESEIMKLIAKLPKVTGSV